MLREAGIEEDYIDRVFSIVIILLKWVTSVLCIAARPAFTADSF